MAKLLKLRRGTTSNHSSFTGAEGECTVDTTKDTLVVHDGSQAGGRPLLREDLNNIGTGVITAAMLAADSVDSSELVDGSIDTAHLSADCVTAAKIGDNVIDSEHYAAASIDHEHLAADCVDGDNIGDDSIDSEHYVDGSIDAAHIATDAVTQAKIADEAVNEARIQISNAGTNGQYLQKQSGNSGGLTWADAAAQGASAGGSVYECVNTISSNYTMTTNSNGVSAGPITLSATVTIPSGSVWSII